MLCIPILKFLYDGKGNRLQAVRDSVVNRYIYDSNGNLLAEADGQNNITRYYIYGLGLLAMVTSGNQVYCYHFNAIGSTIAMTDQTQAMVNKYAYDPFGNILDQVEAVTQPFKFVGKYGVMTEPNGFYYMRARYYDPDVGRFISEDPIGFEGGDVNLYAYVGNNPINRIDPFGLRWYESPTFWMDAIALTADLSIPLTGPVGFVMGAITSFSSTTVTIIDYKHGRATRLDVFVSVGTTVLGLFPPLTLPADVGILLYDFWRAESDAPCKKK